MKKQLVIRLQKAGRISRPFFNIVVCYRKKGPYGAYISKVGYYDPFCSTEKAGFKPVIIYKNILSYWISRGAVPNDSVRKLLF